ncbi:MAG: alpha/beta fold hydrolase, partial [Gammaproteobacteria bacterium]
MNRAHEPAPQTTAPQPISVDVFGRRLTGLRWGTRGGLPTLALHGWLDNANTFNRLAPLLPELDLVALDFAGHGASDH